MSQELSTDKQVIITTSEFSNWLCLFEAIDTITAHATRLSVDLENTNWVKPIAIQRYMHERLPALKTLITRELTTG